MKPKKSLDEWFGIVGVVVALGVFFGVSYFWTDVSAALEVFGWEEKPGAEGKQAKLVAAVFAFAALTPVLALQFVMKRRKREEAD